MTTDFFIVQDSLVKASQSFRSLLAYALLVSSAFLYVGCGTDDIQLPDQELEGVINGEEWTYASANAFLLSTDFQYQVRFLSDKEPVTDPCTLPRPGLRHVKALFRPSIGSFTVSPQAVENNQVQVAFELSPSTSLIASSGFMEVYDINNSVVFGYLQAVLDDDNKVEGSFQIRICN